MNEFNPNYTLIHAIQSDGVVYHAGTPVEWWIGTNRGRALVVFQNGTKAWTTENNLMMIPCAPTPKWVSDVNRATRMYE